MHSEYVDNLGLDAPLSKAFLGHLGSAQLGQAFGFFGVSISLSVNRLILFPLKQLAVYTQLLFGPEILLLGICPRETFPPKNVYVNTHSSLIRHRQMVETNQRPIRG